MTALAAIGIICKTPTPGASKTRLLPLLGRDGAAELAGCFLRDVASAISAVPYAIGRRGYAVYAPEGSEAELGRYLPADFGLLCRRGTTLTPVLLGATEQLLLRGHDCVVLVNADSPTLPTAFIVSAIAALREPGDRVVLGPATDGGYYLIGLKHAHARLFTDIPWSTPAVLATTRQRAAEVVLETLLLPEWYDVDDKDTLATLLAEIQTGTLPFDARGVRGGPAEATRQFLAGRPDLTSKLDCRGGGASHP